MKFQVPGSRFQVPSSKFRVPGFRGSGRDMPPATDTRVGRGGCETSGGDFRGLARRVPDVCRFRLHARATPWVMTTPRALPAKRDDLDGVSRPRTFAGRCTRGGGLIFRDFGARLHSPRLEWL